MKTQQQVQLSKMTGTVNWDAFVTLTFVGKMTPAAVTKAIKTFCVSVERACFGRKKQKRLLRVPIIEQTAEATHVHLLVKKPSDRKHNWFRKLLADKWRKIRSSGWANLRKKHEEGKSSWYAVIADTKQDRDNVAGYITKYVPHDYSSVDIENIVTTSS